MLSRLRGIARRGYLFPRTSNKPILMSEYLALNERSMLIDADRITPEYKAWYERMRKLKRYQ